MGCYVNPKESSKESWLKGNAKERGPVQDPVPEFSSFPAGTLPVILIDNGRFTAAGVAFSKEEYQEFTRLDDFRPRIIYEAKVADLLKVSDLEKYLH
jgi:hypothetical protein